MAERRFCVDCRFAGGTPHRSHLQCGPDDARDIVTKQPPLCADMRVSAGGGSGAANGAGERCGQAAHWFQPHGGQS